MLVLALNITVLLIGVGGALVMALTLSNPVWRRLWLFAFVFLGLIGLGLTVFTYEKTPELISSAAEAIATFGSEHGWLWPGLSFLLGLGLGWYLRPILSKKISARKELTATPLVQKWFEPLEAVQRFADPKLLSELEKLRKQNSRTSRRSGDCKQAAGLKETRNLQLAVP